MPAYLCALEHGNGPGNEVVRVTDDTEGFGPEVWAQYRVGERKIPAGIIRLEAPTPELAGMLYLLLLTRRGLTLEKFTLDINLPTNYKAYALTRGAIKEIEA